MFYQFQLNESFEKLLRQMHKIILYPIRLKREIPKALKDKIFNYFVRQKFAISCGLM